jgi:hypothetical protein
MALPVVVASSLLPLDSQRRTTTRDRLNDTLARRREPMDEAAQNMMQEKGLSF